MHWLYGEKINFFSLLFVGINFYFVSFCILRFRFSFRNFFNSIIIFSTWNILGKIERKNSLWMERTKNERLLFFFGNFWRDFSVNVSIFLPFCSYIPRWRLTDGKFYMHLHINELIFFWVLYIIVLSKCVWVW